MIVSNILLGIAFLIGGFGIFRSGYSLHANIISCLFFGIGLTLISWWIQPVQPRQPITTEKQQATNENKEPNKEPDDLRKKSESEQPTFREKVDEVTFQLGGISITYDLEQLKTTKKQPFNFYGYSPVTLYVEGEQLCADVKIYGGKNKPPIEIVHNDFVVRPLGWDKNFNREAFEVVDTKHNPMFQFIYKSKTHILVNGIFPSGGGLALASEGHVVFNPILPTMFSLKRIFKYPSSKYPGQLDDIFKPMQ